MIPHLSLKVFIIENILNIKHFSDLIKLFLLLTWLGALSGLRKCLVTKSRLKIIKNAFDFTLKALFVLKMFRVLL